MRALVVHIGEGSTHILLATTRRQDLQVQVGRRRANFLQSLGGPEEEERHDHLYVMHDQQVRNGADLSLLYLAQLKPDLREALLHQAVEAVQHFKDMPEVVNVAISSSLLQHPAKPTDDPVVAAFQEQTGLKLRVLDPEDEALWMLRGVRGIYPAGELACAQVGHWRTLGAWERPGRVPRLNSWPAGVNRPPEILGKSLFPDLGAPAGRPLYVTGELAWLTAALQIGLTFHDMDLLDETVLDDQSLDKLWFLLESLSVEQRDMIPMTGHQGDCLPGALRLLRQLRKESGAEQLQVCSRGVVHGLASHLFYEGRRAD